jgi:heme oxygenase
MQTIKKTYKEFIILVNSINQVIGSQETKVQKKLFKLYEKLKKYNEEYTTQLDELRLDNAATDEKGILVVDEKGGYKFNKEGIKKLSKDIEKLTNKEFDFKVVEVVNPIGLEPFDFLKDWVSGVEFVNEEEEEL